VHINISEEHTALIFRVDPTDRDVTIHIYPLLSNSFVNKRQYNSRCYGTALWTRRCPGNERRGNNGTDVFCAGSAGAINEDY
jgi:hypothetical protein